MSNRSLFLRVFLLLLILATSRLLSAQETKVVRDLQLWTGAGIEKSWKDWTLTINEEIRFKQDISEINNYFTEAGLRYRINKNFALEGGYRYTRDKNSDGSYDNLTRYNLDLRFRGKLDYISIHYRLRYQKEVEGFNLLDQTTDYEKYVRNRVRVRYNKFIRIKPYVSAELFQLFRPDYYSELEYIRVLGGIRYEAGKVGTFNLAFGFNREFTDIEPAMIYQFKVNYTYIF
jgi:opacity protein-like surface antigen